jgi:hypothetical protein
MRRPESGRRRFGSAGTAASLFEVQNIALAVIVAGAYNKSRYLVVPGSTVLLKGLTF